MTYKRYDIVVVPFPFTDRRAMKLFTLDNRLLLRTAGTLSITDRRSVEHVLKLLLHPNATH